MHRTTALNKKFCTSKRAASLLDVTTRTVQLWSESGILKAWKTAGGHRRFNLDEIESLKAQFKTEAEVSVEHSLIRILIIEDEPDILTLYKMTIEGWNLPVVLLTAIDGFEGLIQIGAWKPHIVITDIQMPNINGVHLLKTLSQMESYKEMVVMVVSGLSKIDIDRKGGLPKGVALFGKPILFDEIEKIVNQYCETKLKK